MSEETHPPVAVRRAAHGSTRGVMERLLVKLRAGILGPQGQRQLLGEHQRHFVRRVRRLPPIYFREADRSPDGFRALSNDAYMWFQQAPAFSGLTAFTYVLANKLRAVGFLYTWRGSATMRYLREQGSEELRQRCLMLRNVRIHLKEAFVPCGRRAGERLWALSEWGDDALERRPDGGPGHVAPELHGVRGKEAIRQVLLAAGMPLTRSELAKVLLERAGLEPIRYVDHAFDELPAASGESPESLLSDREIAKRVHEFYDSLSETERKLLRARGWGEANPSSLRSFRKVAQELGGMGHESYRLMERRILEAFRNTFDDPEERAQAAVAFAARIQGEKS